MNGPTLAPRTDTPRPAGRPAPRPAAKPAPDAGGGMQVFTYLRLHWLMILFSGTLLGSVLAMGAWEMLSSKYESYALLQVSAAPTYLASQGNREQARTDFATYVKTTAALIKSEFVLNAALRDLKDVPTIKAHDDAPIKFLDEEVLVNWQDGSEVIRISFKGHSPADVKKIVDAVQTAFMKEVVEKDVKKLHAIQAKIEEERRRLEAMLGGKKGVGGRPAVAAVPPGGVVQAGAVGVVNQLAPNAPPLAGPGGVAPAAPVPAPVLNGEELAKRMNPAMLWNRHAKLQDEVDRLPLAVAQAKMRLDSVKARMELLKANTADPASVALVGQDKDVIAHADRVRRAKSQYQFLFGVSQDKNNPELAKAKALAEAEEKALEVVRMDKLRAVEGARRTEEAKKLAPEWDEADRAVRVYAEQYQIAKAQLARVERMLADMPAAADRKDDPRPGDPGYDSSRTALTAEDGVYAALVRQDLLTRMELASPPRVSALQPASSPVQKDMKKQILGTVFAGFLGYALLAAGVIGFEMATRRVSSLTDLKAGVPAPVVGVIPCQPAEATGRDPGKRAAANEAVDKLRAYVAQTWLSRGAATVTVTSPLGDEGKAFVAFGLASSLAQAGYRTLLVDFDLRDPSLHGFAGVPNELGVCEALRGETDPRRAIQTLPSGLHIVPAGKWSDEARAGAVGGRLEAVLAKLKEPYDCVVLHGHALLTVAESIEVARRSEVVLVCARYRDTKLPMLKKAADRVAAMEIPYSGVVYVGATEQESLC